MSPPDAYDPPGLGVSVPYEELQPYLRSLRDEHVICTSELMDFTAILDAIVENGPSDEYTEGINTFFTFVQRVLIPHNQREERELFGLLEQRLIEAGEHSQGPRVVTAVDMLKGDHVQYLQISAVMINFFRIAPTLPDERSRLMVLSAAIRQARELVDNLKLHIFREDEIVFSLAQKLLTTEELDEIEKKSKL